MELGQILSWVIIAVGLLGFYFIGKQKWWAWYVNLACQVLWFVYGWITSQYAFVLSAIIYATIFAFNAGKWTANHFYVKRMLAQEAEAHALREKHGKLIKDELSKAFPDANVMVLPDDGMIIHNTKLDGTPTHTPLDIELIARVCHEANRVLQLADGDEALSYAWHLASEEQKTSSIEGVKMALDGASAIQLHDEWCRRKFEDGWVYGETKDEGMKTHPCLVPYLKLPEEQRIKDHMFRAIVKAFKVDSQEKASAYLPQ